MAVYGNGYAARFPTKTCSLEGDYATFYPPAREIPQDGLESCFQDNYLEAPGCTRVAPFANRKIVAAKSPLAVVASHATLPTSGCMVV